MAKEIKRIVPFDDILKALLDYEHPFPAVFLNRFSDLSEKDLDNLENKWLQINPERRAALLEDLETIAEADPLLLVDEIAKIGLSDPDPLVRQTAIRMLWENQSFSLIPKFIDIILNDDQPTVRAASATSLGQYIYLGELEEIPSEHLHKVEETLLAVALGKDETLVRRRALESLGFSSRPEVKPLIQKAYNTHDDEWLISALFAMGRSADQVWSSSVLEMLDHPNPEVQFEAVRAAGELDIAAAREPLMELLEQGIDDEELWMADIWSLSQIGGEGVREKLKALQDESEEDSEIDFIEEALENLFLTDGFDKFVMFDFEPQDEDDLDTVINLEDEEENTEDGVD